MLNRHLNMQVEVKMVFHKYHNREAIWFSKIFEAACQLWTLLFAYKRPNCTFKCPLKNVFFSWAPAWANKRGLVGAFSRHCETSWRYVASSIGHGPRTCSALDDDDELDAVRLVERPPALLVVVRVPEVPARRVQQPEVVSEVSTITFLSGFSYGNFSF